MCFHCRGKSREERVELHASYGQKKGQNTRGTSNVTLWQGPAVGASEARFGKHYHYKRLGVTAGGATVLVAEVSDGVWLRLVKWVPGVVVGTSPAWVGAEALPLHTKVFLDRKHDTPEARLVLIRKMEEVLDRG